MDSYRNQNLIVFFFTLVNLCLYCWFLIPKPYLTLCDSVDYSLPGSSILGISQARILEWVAISFSRGSSQARNWTQVSWIDRQILYHWPTREALKLILINLFILCIRNVFYMDLWKHFWENKDVTFFQQQAEALFFLRYGQLNSVKM